MASRPSSRTGPSWRPTSSPGNATPRSPGGGWLHPGASGAAPRSRRRAVRLGLVLSALLGTAALLVWLLLWLAPPGPACLVLAGAGYEDNLALAHNARGREALVRLAGLASTSTPLSSLFRRSGRLRLAHAPMEVRRGGDWARGLEGALEKTVVVVLAMHGGADREGAYLWPHDTTGAVEDRIRVGAVLARLAELPRGRNKLLVLDATGLAEMRSAGMLVNDFARALGDLDERIRAVPNLVVLASTDADQRSQPAADGRTTLFMRHLLEGLREGRSAGPGGRLDAWQLYQQVRQRVEDDARRLRGAVQTPVLLPREGGEARARAIPLTFQFGEDGEERPVGEADFASAERAVREAWAGYRTLNPRVAAACAPQAWRLYQAWLVRHEQLRLAGADAAADVALVRAREAAEGVRRGTDLNLATTNASLAMPALAGAVGLWGPDPDPRLERLWRAAPAEQVAAWGELRKGADLPALRRDLQAGLVRRAADNPARNLAAAAALVRLIDDPASAARPAEAHYLVMLQRDLATRPPPAELALLLARALRLRLRAERDALAVGDGGYAYAERIYPATRALIDAADRDRERGQDLAFASTPDDWARGHACLDEAQKKYDQAQGLASALRAAHAARDRALAELPGHAGWIGAVRAAPDDLGKTAAGLFEEARGLERLLAGPPGELGELRRRAARVEGGLDGLQKRLDGFARTCESNSPAAATDAEAVLAAPTLSAEVRFRLVRKLGRLAWRARSAEDGAVTVSAAAEGRERLARARRRATLALAELGAGWFDRVSGKGRESLSDVEQRIRLLDEERWWKPVRLAGDQIGDRVRRLPPDVDRLVRLARQESRVGSPLASLAQADDQVRRLDPGQCQEVQGEPAVLARKARLQGLLVWQAGRAWQGHWYGDDPEATPYFRIVGLDYLRDARDLAPFPGGGVPGADVVRRRLGQDNGLRIGGAPVRRLLAGERMTLANALEPAGGEEVSGYPLFWAEPGAGLILARLQDADRRPVEVRPGKPADRLAVTVASPRLERAEEDPPARAKPESSGVVWRALYRGARLARAQVVELYAAAESVRVLHPRPRAAALAVRSSPRLLEEYGVARGALAIVLDCSGSMGPPQGQAMTENTRFRQATRALRAVLARVPRGVAVSLWVFGQRDGGGATPEDTIMRLQEPVTWRRQAGQLDDLMSRVEGLTPWNETPLVRAMLRAKDDLTRAAGFRTMVVITDGADNRFAGDRVYNPGKESIPDVLKKRFRDSRVAVHVVGFQIADKDEQEARKHFEVLKELTPRGSFTLVNRLDALTRRLDAVMQPGLRYRLVGEVDGEAVRGEEVDVAAEGENDRWLALPGASAAYRLEVSAGWPMAQKIELRPGDAMRVRVYAAGRRPECERLLYGEEESFRRRPAREGRGWRTTVLESRPADGRGLGMLVALEKRPEVGEPVIRQVRPGNVWLEVDPAGVSSGGATVHWGETFGYPAPVWKVGVPGWPASGGGPAAPRLRVWWAPEREGPGRVLRRGPDFRTLRDLAGDVRVAGDEAHLDGVTVERRWVPARAGGREQRWCLVVRASHAPGKLLWARPDTTLALGGQEHRFHTSAARYVGLFWFVGLETREALEEQLDDKLAALQLVSVGAFKKEAEGRMLFAGFNDLSTPAAESGGPRPVLGAE